MMRRMMGLPVVLALAALLLLLLNLRYQLPFTQWWQALAAPEAQDIRQIMVHYGLLPRSAMALLAGAGLGLSGLLFQQVLRNPLAEPATLGVSAGAQFGLTLATVLAVPAQSPLMQGAALLGAAAVALVVFGLSWGKRIAPVTLILAGLVVGLYCGALNSLLALFNYQNLQGMFIWASGALNQQDWLGVASLAPRLLLAFLLALLLLRPLTLLGLDDGVAKNLGLGLNAARLASLALAVIVAAQVVSAAGVIGFIGLFAPILARVCGARRLGARLFLAPLMGALLLWLTDQVVQYLGHFWFEIPAGSATALIGAPVLLWLLPRLRGGGQPDMRQGERLVAERSALWRWLLAGLLLLGLVLAVALLLGRDGAGWRWSDAQQFETLLPWRAPRVAAALAAGMMLAVAGSLIQRLTGNPMASPEVLGVSSGAALGVLIMLLLSPAAGFAGTLPAGLVGAALTLLIILLVSARRGFSTQRMLLTGVALSTVFSALVVLFLASGDPRTGRVLAWMSGSTYSVTAGQAGYTLATALLLIAVTPLTRRWLTALPLGGATARAIGVPLMTARILVLLLVSVLTAAATLIIGPLSFVGLMAPHIAGMLGFRRALPQLIGAALIGGFLMVLADWCGRMILFPYQIPAGLLATFIGVPYFIFLLRRQGR